MFFGVLILMVIGIYILDKVVCFIYCYLQERKNKNKNVLQESNVEKNNATKSKSIFYLIKQLLYGWMMYSVERLGRVPSQKYRVFMLRHIYRMKLAPKVVVYHGFSIRAPWNITVGRGTVIGNGVLLDGRNGLEIGENVNISTDVSVYTEQHDINNPYFESANSGGKVVIGNRAWLSSRTVVLPKVTVGEGAVLASGALAAKDLDEYAIYVGIPAKKIADRNRDLKYEFQGDYIPFY